jgi:hypothetical protein
LRAMLSSSVNYFLMYGFNASTLVCASFALGPVGASFT